MHALPNVLIIHPMCLLNVKQSLVILFWIGYKDYITTLCIPPPAWATLKEKAQIGFWLLVSLIFSHVGNVNM